jgi:putative transcriptional regulator
MKKAKRSASKRQPKKRVAYRLARPDVTSVHWAAHGHAPCWLKGAALTEAEILKAARSDPDARPLSASDVRRMRRVARAKIIRQALNMSQEEFAARFQIPLGTLRDWEQGRVEPDKAARAYLTVIARNPNAVRKALAPTE